MVMSERVKPANLRTAARKAGPADQSQAQLRLQCEVSQILADGASEREACHRILSTACTELNWTWGAFWKLERDELKLLERWRKNDSDLREFDQVSQACRFLEGQGLPGKVWARRQALWISDFAADASMPRRAAAAGCGLHTAFAFPICGRELLGVIEFFNEDILSPDPSLLQTLTAVGAQVGQFFERKRTEQALADSQSLFQGIFRGAQDAILLSNDDGRFIEANPASTGLLGYDREELLGKSPWDLAPAAQAEATRKLWTTFLSSPGIDGESVLVRKDGATVEVEFRATTNIIPGVHLSILRDVSPRKQREEEMRRLVDAAQQELQLRKKIEVELKDLNHQLEQRITERTAALQESHSQLEAFCYSVSHDLRAPLRSMQGFSHALLEDHSASLNEEGKDFARRILSASEHMDSLLADVLAYSRLSRQELKPEPVPVDSVLADVLVQLQSEIKRRQASVNVRGCECCVLANRSVLELMLVNLLDNALKFVPVGKTPRVEIWSDPGTGLVRIWVRDNGIGLPPEHHLRIFRIFERLHGVESYPGTGIGLALVKKAAERMDGNVGVESSPGAGSSFWIDLPSAQLPSGIFSA